MSVAPRGSYNVFGHVAPNGLNFARCIHKPTSRIARVVRYLKDCDNAGIQPTRKEIISKALGRDNVHPSWGTYVFTFGVKNGFLTKTRVGKTYVYGMGPKARAVKLG